VSTPPRPDLDLLRARARVRRTYLRWRRLRVLLRRVRDSRGPGSHSRRH
jgi:hypothetical protein